VFAGASLFTIFVQSVLHDVCFDTLLCSVVSFVYKSRGSDNNHQIASSNCCIDTRAVTPIKELDF